MIDDDDDDGDDDDETTIRNSLYRRLGYNERCQAVNQFRYIALIATKRRSATQATNSRQLIIILFAKLSTDKQHIIGNDGQCCGGPGNRFLCFITQYFWSESSKHNV